MRADLPESIIPGPGHYSKEDATASQRTKGGNQFTKAGRVTYFDKVELASAKKPGPADYGKKRMFDNKQMVDYSKRLSTLNISGVDSDGYGGTMTIEDANN